MKLERRHQIADLIKSQKTVTNTELTDSFTWDSEGGGGPHPFIKVSQVHPRDGKSMGTTAKLPLDQKYRHILFSGEFQDLAQRIVITS